MADDNDLVVLEDKDTEEDSYTNLEDLSSFELMASLNLKRSYKLPPEHIYYYI